MYFIRKERQPDFWFPERQRGEATATGVAGRGVSKNVVQRAIYLPRPWETAKSELLEWMRK